MKFNKWTLGLAAVGVVSLTSAARADETNMVMTALSATTVSGYVDVSGQFNPGGGGAGSTPNYNLLINQANQINLDVVDIALDKALDETPWAAGYHVELWLGPEGTALGTGSAIRSAYIALRTPVGNGIDWKFGVFDTIIGYEGLTSGNNPNFSRSYGFNIEPTTHTGALATYKVCDLVTVQAGVVDTSFANGAYSANINGAPGNSTPGGLSLPTVLGGVSLTAPDSFGWAKGAVLSAVIVNTSGSGANGATSYYIGATLPTPMAALKFGGSFDYLNVHDNSPTHANGNVWNVAGYGTFAFNDKLSLNLRAEHLSGSTVLAAGGFGNTGFGNNAADELTATLQYNIWENVLSRVEVRWDHVEHGNGFASISSPFAANQSEAWLLAAQLIYTF